MQQDFVTAGAITERLARVLTYGPNYHAALLKDPDGYRIEAYCSAGA